MGCTREHSQPVQGGDYSVIYPAFMRLHLNFYVQFGAAYHKMLKEQEGEETEFDPLREDYWENVTVLCSAKLIGWVQRRWSQISQRLIQRKDETQQLKIAKGKKNHHEGGQRLNQLAQKGFAVSVLGETQNLTGQELRNGPKFESG